MYNYIYIHTHIHLHSSKNTLKHEEPELPQQNPLCLSASIGLYEILLRCFLSERSETPQLDTLLQNVLDTGWWPPWVDSLSGWDHWGSSGARGLWIYIYTVYIYINIIRYYIYYITHIYIWLNILYLYIYQFRVDITIISVTCATVYLFHRHWNVYYVQRAGILQIFTFLDMYLRHFIWKALILCLRAQIYNPNCKAAASQTGPRKQSLVQSIPEVYTTSPFQVAGKCIEVLMGTAATHEELSLALCDYRRVVIGICRS